MRCGFLQTVELVLDAESAVWVRCPRTLQEHLAVMRFSPSGLPLVDLEFAARAYVRHEGMTREAAFDRIAQRYEQMSWVEMESCAWTYAEPWLHRAGPIEDVRINLREVVSAFEDLGEVEDSFLWSLSHGLWVTAYRHIPVSGQGAGQMTLTLEMMLEEVPGECVPHRPDDLRIAELARIYQSHSLLRLCSWCIQEMPAILRKIGGYRTGIDQAYLEAELWRDFSLSAQTCLWRKPLGSAPGSAELSAFALPDGEVLAVVSSEDIFEHRLLSRVSWDSLAIVARDTAWLSEELFGRFPKRLGV